MTKKKVFFIWSRMLKNFFVRNLQIYKPNEMFVGKARSLPKAGAIQWCFSCVSYGFNYKPYTRLEMLAKDEHSSLWRFVNNGRKKFYNIKTRGQSNKTSLSIAYKFSWQARVLVFSKPFAREKHSSLLQKVINYRQKSFITFCPGPEWPKPAQRKDQEPIL